MPLTRCIQVLNGFGKSLEVIFPKLRSGYIAPDATLARELALENPDAFYLAPTGETFHNRRFTAAHLTLPLNSWIEVTARATGKKIRCRVNDRGPYVKKFVLDLSQAAARALGVDVAEDRHVDIHIIALPGEDPLPENWELATNDAPVVQTTAVVAR